MLTAVVIVGDIYVCSELSSNRVLATKIFMFTVGHLISSLEFCHK